MRKAYRNQTHLFIDRLEARRLLSAATVNFSTTYQTIDGFGAQPGIGDNPNPPDSALQLAFSQTNGIGLEFIRGSLSANGYNQIVGMTQRAAAYGVQLVESPRGPAVSWLDNYGDATNGELDPGHYQDYANMVADYLQNSAAQGIPVYSVSMAVEPDLATTITPVWNGQQFAALLPYFANTFSARGITTKIMVNEDVGWETADRNQILADPGLSQYVSIVADHGYGQAFNPYQLFSNNMGKQVWMTEYIPQVSTDTQIQNAILTATDIHNAITVAGASAYLDCFLNFGTQGLMSSWTTPNTSLWAMGNFSKFVRPGWVRVGETDDGGLLLTTFKDPVSGKFAIVSINSGTTDVSETYTLNGLSATSVTPYITSTTSNLSAGGAIAVAGGAFTATIPANSIITYYGQSSSAATLQAPVALYAGTVASAQTSQIALSWTDNSPSDSDYTIERSTNGNDWTILTTTWPAGTTTYVDTGLNEASTYYYRVQATSGANASPFSAVATGSTILAAPSNVSSTGISGGRNLTWAINSGVSTGVSIQRSTDGLIWSTVATLNSRATSYSDTIGGYNSNEIYWYRVRNTYGSQTSAYGAYNTTVNTPTNFKASLASPTSVTLTWTNTAVGAYAAYINQNGTLITPPNLSANADTFTATGLTENTAYSFTVQALGPEAWFRPSAQITYGAWSAAATVSITTPVAPPTGLTAVSTVAGTAVLNWVDNSAVETAYQVERSINGTSWTVLSSTLAAGTTTYPDNSAPTSGPVYYRVKALASTVSSAYIRTQMVSAVPTITTNATVTSTTTNLSATAPGGFGSGSLIYTWSIGGTPPASVGFSANGTTAAASTVATFAVAGAYVFRVTISDSSGNSTTATSTVTVNQTLSSITVTDTASPASFSGGAVPVPAIVKSTWQQLVATGLDQFGTKLTAQPTFTWSVVSGGGSVSSAGLYSAPTSAASPVVRASSGAISGQVALSVLNTAQLKADYSFNETSGWNLQDTLGVGITAKMSGGATLVPGHLGDAVNFDGISGSVWLGNPDSLDIRGQITMAAWIKPTSTSGTQMIVGRAVAHFPNQSATYLRISNGQYQVGFYDSNFRNAAFTIPAGDVGQWVYLVGTYDGKNWNLYRNGTLVSTFANSKGSTYVPESWRIGSTDQPDSYFSGSIDSVRLYAQALSATEVSALYNQTMVVTSSAAASPSTVTNATTNLSVAAVDPDSNSDADFTYNWSLGSGPAAVGFSVNGTNAAKNTVATFSALGTYTLLATITDISGASVTSSVNVVVNTIVGTGGNDTIRLVRSNSTTLAVYINNPTAPAYSVAFSSLGAININPLGGNDTIILDFSGAGSPIPSAGLSINSSTGQDTLNLIGASGSNTANLSSSSLTFDGSTISYSNIASVTLPQSTSFSTLTIQSGAQLTLGNSVMLLVGQLTLSGALDLNNGEMVLQNGGSAGLIQITSALESGFNASTGYWNGPSGIISDAAAGDSRHIMAVGALLNSAGFYGPSNTFNGYSAATTDVLVKYTYFGDSNLDGTVNATDYTAIDNGFNNGSTGWSNGDFNYDGPINGDDYALIDNAFNTQSGAGPAIARPQALIAQPKARPAMASVQFVNAPAPAIAQANATVIDQLDDLNIVPVLFTKPGAPDHQDTAVDNLLRLLAISERTLADPDHI